MKMQTALQLVPHVKPTGDRNAFQVVSRSENADRFVDMEAREGQGACDCEDFRMNKNYSCYHIWQVRKWISIVAVQGTMPVEKKR